MSKMLSTDIDQSSETATWIVLIGSGLALVIFFGWITKNILAQVSPDQESMLVQPSTKSASASDSLKISTEPLATHKNRQRRVTEQGDRTAYAISSASKTTPAIQETLAEPTSRSVTTQRPSDDLAALRQLVAEAAAINETQTKLVPTEHKQREKLKSLRVLCADIQFAPGSKAANESVISTLIQIQQILAEFPETMINVIVATNESGNEETDIRLSQERGRTLIAKLVNSGLAFSRFSLHAITDQQLPANSHRVEIRTKSNP